MLTTNVLEKIKMLCLFPGISISTKLKDNGIKQISANKCSAEKYT